MGCDIHLFVEKKENNIWKKVYGDFCDDRDYDLFSILADVRNGSGFAGCDTGTGFIPISKPKGLPKDVSKEIQEEYDDWDIDGHSHSWHTLKDLLEYDWTQITEKHGMLDAKEYKEWLRWKKGEGKGPSSYCSLVSGPSIHIISEKEMEDRIVNYQKEHENNTELSLDFFYLYCNIKWKEPYYRAAKDFWSETIPRLLRLGKLEDVRIVFWFDN